MMTDRHLAWFRVDDGFWLGEWAGRVPAPMVPPSVIGDARLMLLNEWVQQTQRLITPSGSPYEMRSQVWDRDAWDDCPAGGAVCLDVTLYGWPVGDFYWSVFDGVDRLLDFREMRAFLQLSTETLWLDANVRSPRPIRSTPAKVIGDVTGTPLAPWIGRLHGQFVKRDGRIVFQPNALDDLPEAIALSLTDRNPDLGMLTHVDAARLQPALVP